MSIDNAINNNLPNPGKNAKVSTIANPAAAGAFDAVMHLVDARPQGTAHTNRMDRTHRAPDPDRPDFQNSVTPVPRPSRVSAPARVERPNSPDYSKPPQASRPDSHRTDRPESSPGAEDSREPDSVDQTHADQPKDSGVQQEATDTSTAQPPVVAPEPVVTEVMAALVVQDVEATVPDFSVQPGIAVPTQETETVSDVQQSVSANSLGLENADVPGEATITDRSGEAGQERPTDVGVTVEPGKQTDFVSETALSSGDKLGETRERGQVTSTIPQTQAIDGQDIVAQLSAGTRVVPEARVEQPTPVNLNPVAGSISVSAPSAPATPATTPATPTPPVYVTNLQAQIVEQIRGPLHRLRADGEGTHYLRIAINPETFGPIRLSATFRADGSIHLQLMGARQAAQDQLRQNLDDLRRDLASTGLQADLDLAQDSGAFDREFAQAQGEGAAAAGPVASIGTDAEETQISNQPTVGTVLKDGSDGEVDMYA